MTTGQWRVLLLICSAILLLTSTAYSQSQWKVPNLTELSARDEIARNRTQLSTSDVAILHRVTAHAISACVAGPGPGDPKTTAGLFNELRIRRVLLNNDGEHGLIVQGSAVCMCGATGNCDFWLLDEGAQGSKLVLQAIGIQSFDLTRSLAQDRFNIVTRGHSSASQSWLQKFVFDGNRYRRTSCALMDYMDYSTMQALKTPIVSETRCNP
jgi:hypothetical protein